MNIKPNPFHKEIGINKIIQSNGKEYSVRHNRNRYFFPDEWQLFYDNLMQSGEDVSKQKVTFSILLNTGARIMEIQHVTVSDIDIERGNIILRKTKRIVNRPGVDKKGVSKMRVVSISSQHAKFLRKVIKQYHLKHDDTLPILSCAAANIALKKTLKKIGVPDHEMFSVHNIRKTNENWLLAIGVDFYKIVKQLGHAPDISMKHYISSDIFSFDEKRHINQIMGDVREKMMGNIYGR